MISAVLTSKPASTAPVLVHPGLNAPNVWTLPLPEHSLTAAKNVFDSLLPYLEAGLMEDLDKQPLPCTSLDAGHYGRYFVMRAGSSTNEELRDSSDLAWISVDDKAAWDLFHNIFWSSGLAEAVAPQIDLDRGIRLYSSFFVVRSRCAQANFHTDWDDSVGTNAFTVLAPLEDYFTDDFQLLYHETENGSRESGGFTNLRRQPRQYRYRRGEALTFSSRFVHSTEPGASIEGHRAPHAFLCFTFGTDKAKHWDTIEPTIGGYQSRFLCRYDGKFELTEIGRHLREEEVASGRVRSDNAPVVA